MKVSLNVADELVERVRAFGQRMGMSQSEAFRYLIASGLSVELWRGAAIDSAAAAMAMVEMAKQMPEEVEGAAGVLLEEMAKGSGGGSRARAHACSNTRDPRPKVAGSPLSTPPEAAEIQEVGGDAS